MLERHAGAARATNEPLKITSENNVCLEFTARTARWPRAHAIDSGVLSYPSSSSGSWPFPRQAVTRYVLPRLAARCRLSPRLVIPRPCLWFGVLHRELLLYLPGLCLVAVFSGLDWYVVSWSLPPFTTKPYDGTHDAAWTTERTDDR